MDAYSATSVVVKASIVRLVATMSYPVPDAKKRMPHAAPAQSVTARVRKTRGRLTCLLSNLIEPQDGTSTIEPDQYPPLLHPSSTKSPKPLDLTP
jgi:hypothetical protein